MPDLGGDRNGVVEQAGDELCVQRGFGADARAVRPITAFEPLREVMRRSIAEMTAVARAEGVAVDEDELVGAAFRLGDTMREATSSTEQNIALGRPTEIESLNGFAARRGAAHGIPTPVNDTLTALVKMLEQTGR